MAIQSSELIFYNSANMPLTDSTTTGGAIDTNRRPAFTQMSSNAALEIVSGNAGDTTQVATVSVRDPAGAIDHEGVTLNGTTEVDYSTLGTVERILRLELDGTAAGTVTLRANGGTPVFGHIPPGELGFTLMFYDSASDPSTTETRYEKIFARNESAESKTLNNAVVRLVTDNTGVINIDLESSVDGSEAVANRQVEPSNLVGVWTGTGSDIAVPGNALAVNEGIGIWARQSLSAGNAPIKNTFTVRIAGTST